MRIGILYSRVRVEEKLLFEKFDERGVQYDLIDDREVIFDLPLHSLHLGLDDFGEFRLAAAAGPLGFVRDHRQRRLESMREIAGSGDGAANHAVVMVEQGIQIVDERLHFRREFAGDSRLAPVVDARQPRAQPVQPAQAPAELHHTASQAKHGDDRKERYVSPGRTVHEPRPRRIAQEQRRRDHQCADEQPERPEGGRYP